MSSYQTKQEVTLHYGKTDFWLSAGGLYRLDSDAGLSRTGVGYDEVLSPNLSPESRG